MALINITELRRVVHFHYLVNIFLALSFILLKSWSPFCHYLFDSCVLTSRESEILFFTAVVIVFRTRKHGAVNFFPYLSTACMLAKLGNMVLWFSADPIYGVLFSIFSLLHFLYLPEPCHNSRTAE